MGETPGMDLKGLPPRCEACEALDLVDGEADGNFSSVHAVVRTEHHLRETIKRAENRSADRITQVAGSMNFIYVHTIWFAVWVAINEGMRSNARTFTS